MTILASLSPRSLSAPESGIVELVNYARGREGLIPLWVGEGDLPTPDFISKQLRSRCPPARPSTPGSAGSRPCGRRCHAITSAILPKSFRQTISM